MTGPVKRRYDTSRRAEQARENRRRILTAASGLFREKGYAGTAMPEVAKTAGVSVQTVYKAFANKATLLKAVFDVTVAGDDEDVPIADRDFIAAIQAEPSAARKIEMYFAHLAGVGPAVFPVQLLARDAAAADPAAAEVWAQMRAETLTAMTYFSADLLDTGEVRAGLSAEDVRDVLWTYHGPEQYELLCQERGWSPQRYGEFLRAAVTAAVLD
ncbi:TetR/AcrR family transcriptional regulator [Amycolatopsis nalaikhensis]|uniref:Helix-turn-helix domain-containing protein n=1 Tax=Amycolatopsis nalaikhensis TaxID=715472 RepID=A0ABY8XP13_9PSEU|nr:helix-turn-helix domain-containing protein [Amycolatopsis sp. 2-2]WIV57366.1 helix-turn-helix domain-containing protein [Amycolatopsis sp. 2-2]